MRRTLFIYVILLMLPVAILAQGMIQQKGIAYRYNGKQKRTPLGNVTISYAGNSRSVISSEGNGTNNDLMF